MTIYTQEVIVFSATIMAFVLLAMPVNPPSTHFEDVKPLWATERWVDFASHIVASEARGVPQADLVIACTMVRDVEKGWYPWALRSRWFGWGRPDAKDIRAVEDSLTQGGCDEIPDYRYVGNFRDVQYWRSIGMIGEGPFDLYVGFRGQAVVGVP